MVERPVDYVGSLTCCDFVKGSFLDILAFLRVRKSNTQAKSREPASILLCEQQILRKINALRKYTTKKMQHAITQLTRTNCPRSQPHNQRETKHIRFPSPVGPGCGKRALSLLDSYAAGECCDYGGGGQTGAQCTARSYV